MQKLYIIENMFILIETMFIPKLMFVFGLFDKLWAVLVLKEFLSVGQRKMICWKYHAWHEAVYFHTSLTSGIVRVIFMSRYCFGEFRIKIINLSYCQYVHHVWRNKV